MNSITKRWVRGSLLITIVVLLLAEAVFLYYTINSRYETARRAMQMRTQTLLTQLSASDAQTAGSRGSVLRRMVEQFTDKDKFELALLDENGNVAVSSTGYVSRAQTVPDDYVTARESGSAGDSIYETAMGEKVMAVTTLLPNVAGDFVAVRMVTSLSLVDQSILTYILASLAAVGVILLFSVWSGMFFIRSIVRPIGEIEQTASKIAKGNLDIRIENTYNDEIGKLAGTINRMAGDLDKTERMKNEFISSVSHELRTPLTSIKGWVETLGTLHDPADPAYRRGVQVIASETDRLYDMVEELLDFSRMQNGIKLDCHVLDLVAEVSDSVLTAEKRIQLEGMHLDYEEPLMPVPVFADTGRLRQVFLNILDNAVKYSPPGGTITVAIEISDESASVTILDEGRGISAEDLENVKVKFFKGKGAVRGSGIGLAVVDEIAKAHGGSLALASEQGRGTAVTLRLPVYKKPLAPLSQ